MTAQRAGAPEHNINSALSAPFYVARRHLVDFLQWRFSKNPPGSYHFSTNDDGSVSNESEIFIAGDTPKNPEQVGNRPAITVTRGSASFAGMSLNDTSFHDMRNGAKIRLDLVPVTLVVNFLGRDPAEAEAIAAYGVQQVWALRDAIVVSSPVFHAFGHQPQVGPPSPAESLVSGSPDFEWSAVVVNFPCYLVESVTTAPLNKRIHQGTTVHVKTKD